MFRRFQRGGRRWWGGSPAAVRAFGETVKRNDSGGLLFERLPACQFRCNGFLSTASLPQPDSRAGARCFCSTAEVEGFSRKRVRLGNLGRKSPPHQPPTPHPRCLSNYVRLAMFMLLTQKRNALGLTVRAFWVQKSWLIVYWTDIPSTGSRCAVEPIYCAQESFIFCFWAEFAGFLTGKYRHRFKILTVPFLLKLNTLNDVINKNDPPVIQ